MGIRMLIIYYTEQNERWRLPMRTRSMVLFSTSCRYLLFGTRDTRFSNFRLPTRSWMRIPFLLRCVLCCTVLEYKSFLPLHSLRHPVSRGIFRTLLSIPSLLIRSPIKFILLTILVSLPQSFTYTIQILCPYLNPGQTTPGTHCENSLPGIIIPRSR